MNTNKTTLILSVLIPSAIAGIMSAAPAVIFHEASELMAVANGLRVGIKHESI